MLSTPFLTVSRSTDITYSSPSNTTTYVLLSVLTHSIITYAQYPTPITNYQY